MCCTQATRAKNAIDLLPLIPIHKQPTVLNHIIIYSMESCQQLLRMRTAMRDGKKREREVVANREKRIERQ